MVAAFAKEGHVAVMSYALSGRDGSLWKSQIVELRVE